ncbi:hypothetical protein DFO77_10246 [Marinilabilia salmonicolor]|uniref:Uncharacterized protein n=1 Tax=Marinilabilia salmonicolor TaxID=989 RepID=A0A368VCQ3_9BACT|nr:hypothetical protein DFO77_10246 [Marinilabilia salmonicolor]
MLNVVETSVFQVNRFFDKLRMTSKLDFLDSPFTQKCLSNSCGEEIEFFFFYHRLKQFRVSIITNIKCQEYEKIHS